MSATTLPIEAAPPPVTIHYRLATDADGPAIGRLFAACDYGDLGVNWARADVTQSWVVAERGGILLGAIQVFLGQPYGVIGDCVVLPQARARSDDGAGQFGRPGVVARALYGYALKALKATGAQVALGVTRKPGMMRLIGRYGGVPLGTCESFARDLTR